MNFRFLSLLLKRMNGRAPGFSSALEEGIKDTFKEMGYNPGKMPKSNDENKTPDCRSKNNGQETFKKASFMKQTVFISLLLLITALLACKKYNVPFPVDDNPPREKKWIVTTVAGNGAALFADGPAATAEFNAPQDIVVNEYGVVYVADAINHRIRKIMTGQVSSFAGSGIQDTTGGVGTAAGFAHPIRLALDAAGNIYTLDVNDFRVRKITPAAVVTAVAGSGVRGFKDGSTDVAEFGESLGIAADQQGNIYVSDWENKRIRKISTSGQVTTFFGPAQSGFGGITIDQLGNLYVADINNFRILKITADGIIHPFAGNGSFGFKDGNADEAMFGSINDIVADEQGNIYASDENRIRKITAQGVVSTIAGNTGGYLDGDGISAKFNLPNGLAVDKQGNIYVADNNNNRIRKISFQ
jgi:DNA-binding beta-propeller fold protein YncE